MVLTDTSEDTDAHFRYIASKKKIDVFFEVDIPTVQPRIVWNGVRYWIIQYMLVHINCLNA